MSDTSFDLGTNTALPLSAALTDASGATVTGINPSWSGSDAAVADVTDNGDGTATVTRTNADGGTVIVTATVINADGSTASGTITLTLGAAVEGSPADTDAEEPPVAGNVTDVTIVPGNPIP